MTLHFHTINMTGMHLFYYYKEISLNRELRHSQPPDSIIILITLDLINPAQSE